MKPSQIFDPPSRARIVEAVKLAEGSTTGEIVVAIVHACDDYGAAGWRCGAVLAALTFLALVLFAPELPMVAYLAAQALAVAIGHLVTRFDLPRRVFISDATMELCAQRRASAGFAELGLRHTSGKSGILILVALLEHRVVVLADQGINDVLEPGESWGDIVDLVLAGIESGNPTDGIVDAVRRCGEILSHPLPAGDDNEDEIRRELVLED